MSTLRRALTLLSASLAVGISAFVLIPAASASAHDYLVDSSPEPNSVQTTPLHQVRLTFDDIVLNLSKDGSSALLQVTGPGASPRHFETGCPTIADRDVSAPVALGGPGKYTVTWQIVSADGHVVSNSIQFTYQPPTGTPEAKGTDSRPTCGKNTSGAPSTANPATVPSTSSTAPVGANLGIVVGIGIGIVVLAGVALAIVLITRQRE